MIQDLLVTMVVGDEWTGRRVIGDRRFGTPDFEPWVGGSWTVAMSRTVKCALKSISTKNCVTFLSRLKISAPIN